MTSCEMETHKDHMSVRIFLVLSMITWGDLCKLTNILPPNKHAAKHEGRMGLFQIYTFLLQVSLWICPWRADISHNQRC